MCYAQQDVELKIRNLLVAAYHEIRGNGHDQVRRASDIQTLPAIESDLKIRCQQCDQFFEFTMAEQTFYQIMGYMGTPHRCTGCRSNGILY
ncbi:hypothetical protein LCGC14_1016080 [marine sediment metagenome]|uniref:Probable zinc-binding domain-containing protein n=1 Tax=marine sediment metagenome TaxID=412755 RepID=A0A0F9N3D3_9ZZZZ